MNETILQTGDALIIALSIVLSFILGGLLRLGHSVSSERREVDQARLDMRDLENRYDRQQVDMARLGAQLNEMRATGVQPAYLPPQAIVTGPAMAIPAVQAPVQAMAMPVAANAGKERRMPSTKTTPSAAPVTSRKPRAAVAPASARPAEPQKAASGPALEKTRVARVTTASKDRPKAGAVSAPATGSRPAPAKQAAPRPPSAIELARGGAGIARIMKVCGLSRAEAELVVSVHGRTAA